MPLQALAVMVLVAADHRVGWAQVWSPGNLGISTGSPTTGFGATVLVADVTDDGLADLFIYDAGSTNGRLLRLISSGRSFSSLSVETGDSPGDHLGTRMAAGHFANGPGESAAHLAVAMTGVDGDSGMVREFRRGGDGVWSVVQTLSQGAGGMPGTAEAGDYFGIALAVGDFNNDGADDLAIGVPYEDLTGGDGAGSVNVVYGSLAGLASASGEAWNQGTPDVPDDSEPDDNFGLALAAADFNGDGFDDLAIGAPGEMVDGEANAGAVTVLYGSSGGLVAAGALWLTEGDGTVPGTPEVGDRFGSTLEAGRLFHEAGNTPPWDLVIGVPAEGVDGHPAAGAIFVLAGQEGAAFASPGTLIVEDDLPGQGSADFNNFGTALTTGDFGRDRYQDIAVGAPGWNEERGIAYVIVANATGLHPGTARVWGNRIDLAVSTLNEESFFGSRLSAGDIDGDGHTDLAIGVPQWDGPGQPDVGIVQLLFGALFADGFELGNANAW